MVSAIAEGKAERGMLDLAKAPATVAWLTNKHTDAESMLKAPDIAGLVTSLRLPVEIARSKTVDPENVIYRLWDGASDTDVFFVAMARRAEQILTEAFPEGAPSKAEQQRWLHFVALGLQLAIALNEVKVASFKAQLVRQIVANNPLGMFLCVRSLIEHKAVANWLVGRLGSQWNEIGKRVMPAENLPPHSTKLEEALAKFLTGTMGSAENELPWTMREVHGRWTIHLSLPDIVQGAFKSADKFQQVYNIASAALHGRIYRGFDLLARRSNNGLCQNPLGVLVLEWLCDPNERMDLHSRAFILNTNIEHAASRGGTAAASSEAQVQGAFGHFKGKLKAGKDYTGDGSQENPFRFRPHLQFLPASYRLLQQMDVEYTGRQLRRDAEGRFCDCYHAASREWWFSVPEVPPG